MRRIKLVLVLAMTALPAAAAPKEPLMPASAPAAVQRAMSSFSADAIRAHDRFLSSDLLEGRGPGTRGDALATTYIAAQFEAAGLEPAGENGTYFQNVALVGVTTDPAKTTVSFTRSASPAIGPLKYLDEFVGDDQRQMPAGTLDSELLFVGHGVVAPEYRWDDYKGVDTRGKTLVMLVDDPPASENEPDLFRGRARTYYGRWTYKYEIGAAKGAAGVILIHTDPAAGYGWNVVRNSWGRETAYTRVREGDPALRFASWITQPVANQLFHAAGLDLAALTRAAASRDFKPVPLGGYRLTGTIASTIRPFDTRNVIARVPGSDPKLKDQAVVYSAHHDHLGIGLPDSHGDTIYNGAIDNASGVALLIDLARVWAHTTPAPKRSIVFAAVAAEEQGLLGSEWFGQHPVISPARIALAINYDAIFEYGRVRDVTMLGAEKTTFYPTAERVAHALGLRIVPDLQPEQGSYYRSDHFSLAKVGVPAFSLGEGQDVIGKPKEYAHLISEEYRNNRYHQPGDEFDPSWDWSTAVQMGQLGYWLGWEAAASAGMPNWNAGEEFRAVRDRSIAGVQ